MAKILKAAEGRTVDQEDGTPWPSDGLPVTNSLFIRRRLSDGDLIEVEVADAPAETEAPAADAAETPVPGDAQTKSKAKGAK